jgi:hypothetical protein
MEHTSDGSSDPGRPPDTLNDDASSAPIGTLLKSLSQELDPAACDQLSELGIYTIQDHQTVEKLTLPADAEQFAEATTVKQYYYDDDACPLLLVAPIDP